MYYLESLFVLFSLFVSFTATSQNLDSLLQALPTMKEDTNKTIALQKIASIYLFTDLEYSKKYTDTLLRLTTKISDNKRTGQAYQLYGEYYYRNNDWLNMKRSLEKAKTFFSTKTDKAEFIPINSLYAQYYSKMGDSETAINMYLKSLRSYEELNDKAGEGKTLSSIAFLMGKNKRYKEAEDYYLKAIRIRKELGDKRGESLIYLNLGSFYCEQEQYEKAYPTIQAALTIQKELGDKIIIAGCEANLANLYNKKNEYQQSLNLTDKLLPFYIEQNNTQTLIILYIYRAASYTGLKDQEKALKQLELADQLLISGDKITEAYINSEYYKTYKAFGNTAQALKYYEKTVELEKENNTLEMQNNISKLKELYETEQKEQENKELKQANEINQLQLKNNRYLLIGILSLSVLIILVSLLIIRTNRIKSREKNVQLQQKLLVSQMNPHFIFNSLNSIQNFIYKQDALNASTYLSRFSELMRMILTFSRKDQITLAEEKQLLERYLEIQKLRFGDKLTWEITSDESIDEENVLIQPMLAQPFIENSLEHGLFKSQETGIISIRFNKEKDYLIFEVEDNGTGLDTAVKKSGSHESLATRITHERISGIRTLTGKNTVFEVINLKDLHPEQHGVKVVFKIPYQTLL